jgi:MFS family permease
VLARLARLHPFRTPEARRLALLFGAVYFAQGLWYLPDQTISIVLKDRGLGAAQVATFFAIVTVPWLVKPVYGLISDFVPLFGRRRTSWFLLSAAVAAAAGFTLALAAPHDYGWLAALVTLMATGIAFTDVLTDALMVEHGRPLGLTGAFQSVQWAMLYVAAIVVGVLGGRLAEGRSLHAAFFLTACFPLASLLIAWFGIREARAPDAADAFGERLDAVRAALREREVWVVTGFILFWTFSPSFGTPLLYYQTDTLKFSQQFIGNLAALASISAVIGAVIYAPLSRRVRLQRLIVVSIGLGVAGTLVYLLYRDPISAVVISAIFGVVGMITQLAFLDLAAKACPRRVEGTFFALIMSVYNGGTQGAQVLGGWLFDALGFTPLVLISAAATAAAWVLVPLVRIDAVEARARAESPA